MRVQSPKISNASATGSFKGSFSGSLIGSVDGIDLPAFSASVATNFGTVTGNYTELTNIPSGIVSSSVQSTANVQSSLDLKANLADPTFTGTIAGISKAMVGLGNVANESKATMFTSPVFTGTTEAPTPPVNNNSVQIATTQYVQQELTDLLGGAPAAYDTLLEISASIANGDSDVVALTATVGGKLPQANNLNDLTNAGTARTSLGLGTAATTAASDYVNVTGNQTIAGVKTFSGEIIVPHGKISLIGGNNLTISGTAASHAGLSFATNAILPATVSATNTNTVDLGAASEKFKNLYLGSEIISSGGATFSGDVGIGTTSPSQKLTVEGNIFIGTNGSLSWSGKGSYVTSVPGNAAGYIYSSARNPDNGSGTFPFNQYGEMVFQGNPRSGYNGGFSWATGQAAYGATVAPTIKMVLTTAGNVGIGTTSPGAKLHNYSTATTNVFITGYGTAAQNNWQAQNAFFVKTDNGILISKENADNNTNRLFNFYNNASAEAEMYMYRGGSTSYIKLDTNGDSYLNGGNVGIGTTSPGSILTVVGGTSTFVYDNSPQGTASSVYRDAVFGSTQTVNTGITIFGTGQSGIAFGDAASHIRGQVRYQHSSDTLELGTAGNLNLSISDGGDATFSHLIKTPQGIVLQGNGIPSGKTGLSSAGDGNHMRFYIGGVHTVTGMTTSEIVHEVQSTTGIRYQQNANEAIRRKEIFKAFAASSGASSANWCRLYIPHFYANGPQGVRAEIKICYHPVHASNAAYYEYVLYTSSYTAARPMYAKVRLVHQETGFGWNYYAINNAVNFAIGDTSGNIGRYIYMNIVGGHSSYNKARSVHVVATGGANISDLTLDTGVAAPSVSAAITIGGGPALSPG